MNTRLSQRHMSREEREQRARLGSGASRERPRQLEQTAWGRALLIGGAVLLLAGAIGFGWRTFQRDAAGEPGLWMLLWYGTLSLAQAWVAVLMLWRLLRWLRQQNPPEPPKAPPA